MDSIGVTCSYSALLSSLAVFAVITTRLKEYPPSVVGWKPNQTWWKLHYSTERPGKMVKYITTVHLYPSNVMSAWQRN